MNKQELEGLLAHEVAHVEQFSQYSFIHRSCGMFIAFLLDYFPFIQSEKSITAIEKDADYRALKHGFGKELIALRKYLESIYSAERVKKLRSRYLTIKEIKSYIKHTKTKSY